jgi:N-formylmaleamate deformylase
MIDANGLRHRVLTFGTAEGSDLFFVPGITSPAETVQFIAAALPEYRVHVPDLRGRGQTDRAASGHYRLDDYRDDLAALIDALDLQSATVVGHSLGARIAAAWAAEQEPADSRVVLVDPPTSGPGRAPYPMSAESFARQIEQARAGTTPDQVRAFFPAWPERELRLRVEVLADCDPLAVAETHYGFEHDDFFAIWQRLRGNVALIYGRQSPVVPESAVAELGDTNPEIPIYAVAGAGHMVPWDSLAGFIDTLRDALQTMSLTRPTQESRHV